MSEIVKPKGFSYDLSGRTVLVTGASSGLGKRFALILAVSGAKLVLAARRTALLEDLKADIEAAGSQAVAVAMDVADEASVIAAYDAAEAAFGPVDSVVANAGNTVPGSLLGLPAADFDRIVSVNLRGVFLTIREGARRMIAAGSAERGHGRIVIISSVTGGAYVSAGDAAYSATKAGATQLGRVFAKELINKGVNVNILAPGYIRTELTDEFFQVERGLKKIASFPRRRIMDADVLDAALLHLCSDVSAQVTGSLIALDDGQTL